jgi:hypothetical protein
MVCCNASRYIAVCAPFFRLRHNIKARFYILPILLFAPLYNVPRFFEFTTVTNATYSCLDNATSGPHIDSSNESAHQSYDQGSFEKYTFDILFTKIDLITIQV